MALIGFSAQDSPSLRRTHISPLALPFLLDRMKASVKDDLFYHYNIRVYVLDVDAHLNHQNRNVQHLIPLSPLPGCGITTVPMTPQQFAMSSFWRSWDSVSAITSRLPLFAPG